MRHLHQARKHAIMLVAILVTGIVASCEKAENKYSSFNAYFTYQPVSAKPILHRACASLGEFCSITFPPGQTYVIKSPGSPESADHIPRTALQDYSNFILGIGQGLIIGMPILPEMMEEESKVICYDLCCPNCYQGYHIQKHLELQSGGISRCSSCHRTYDLNNLGIVRDGEGGRSLFRYYCNYYPPTQKITVNSR